MKLENEWFCPSCNSCKESIKDTSFIQSAAVLVIHLKRFCIEHKVIKDNQFFKCFPEDPPQTRLIDSNKVSFLNSYSLVATVTHSDSLNNEHYCAIMKDDTTTNSSLAMIKLSLKLKLMTTITEDHMCSFMRENDLVFILFLFPIF